MPIHITCAALALIVNWCWPLAGAEFPPHVKEATVFAHKGTDWYRIPSIVVSPKGVVLAFASRRKGSLGDFGHESDVVLRRSLDNGATWQPMQTLVTRPDTDIHHGPAVIDRRSGRIFKFCRYWPVKAEGGPCAFVTATPYERMKALGYLDHVVWSDDEGATWSQPRSLPLPFPPGASSAATGNGVNGIQLADGRLLIQGGYVLGGKRHTCVLLSDDAGGTWRLGATESVSGSLREFGMAAVADGTLYANLRAKGGYRLVGVSTDRGETFGTLRPDKTLVEPFCHAGLVRLPGEGDVLAFSNPANDPRTTERGKHRTRLTIRLSRDGGATWPLARVLHAGPAAYSALTALPDGAIGCLYECGERSPYETVAFARVDTDWLAAGSGGTDR